MHTKTKLGLNYWSRREQVAVFDDKVLILFENSSMPSVAVPKASNVHTSQTLHSLYHNMSRISSGVYIKI